MAFNVKILFTGLCCFKPSVPWAGVGAGSNVKVIAVNGGGADTAERVPQWRLFPDVGLQRHVAFLRAFSGDISSANVQNSIVEGDHFAWLFDRTSVVTFSFEDDGTNSNDLSVAWDPRLAGKTKAKMSDGDWDSLTWLANLSEIVGAANAAIPQSVLNGTQDASVRARFEIFRGRLAVEDLKAQKWSVPAHLGLPSIERPLANFVVLTLSGLKSFEIRASVKNGSVKRDESMKLAKESGTVVLTIANLPAGHIFEMGSHVEAVKDDDFKWYYQLLSAAALGRIRDGLAGHGNVVPVPEPVKSTTSMSGAPLSVMTGTGINCFPSTPP